MIPVSFSLSQPYPNPFNSTTTIRFSVNESVSTGKTSLQIFDIHGRLVASLIDGFVNKGRHEIQWDASTQSSGIYLIVLQTQGYTQTVKSIYLK
jgi:flagellar hook assembly protein FlgD